MAIVKMKKLRLMAVRSEKEELLRELAKYGCVEFSELEGKLGDCESEELMQRESSALMALKAKHASLGHALSLLDKYTPVKKKLLSAPPEVDGEVLLDTAGVDKALNTAGSIEASDDRIRRIGAEESRQRSVIESLKPWLELDMPLQTEGTERCSVLLGSLPIKQPLNNVQSAVCEVSEEAELFPVSEDKSQRYVLIVSMKEDVPALQDSLRALGFTPSAVTGMTGTARECTEAAEESLKKLAEEKAECTGAIELLADEREELKLTADKVATQIALAEAEEKLFGTKTTLVMEGWMPAEREEELSALFDGYDCAWESSEPTEEEYPQVPVKLKNNKVTNALNMVTNMYSLPQYGTVDPNPLMAPFFILFYGLMMADMGYGILMVVAALVALKKMKPQEGSLAFCQLLLYGGIATFLMGVLTGSFFSDIPYQAVHLINPNSTWPGLWHLFSPETDSTLVLYGALALGVLHLNTGLAVSFVQKIKAGDTAAAIWEEGSLWVILIGAVLAVLKIGSIAGIPVVLAIGVVMLLFGSGRGSKGIIGKLGAAFGCIYNTATGWFGDVLSYSRIMALMLAGGVVGKVFNTVAVMPAKNGGITVVSVIAFILIFTLGHAMNFALNLLGCYVHDLRLQCLEFFGKFYTDGGKPFRPLKVGGKYVRAK